MEKEQLEKKVEWLDAERRKAIAENADLQKRLEVLEKALLKDQKTSASRSESKAKVKSLIEQVEEIEAELKSQGTEFKKQLQELALQRKAQEKGLAQDQKGMTRVLDDFRKEISDLQALRKGLNEHSQTLLKVTGKVDQLDETITEVARGEAQRAQVAKNIEKNSQDDIKRLTEMHAQVTALIARLETAAKRTELILDGQRKVDKRVDELAEAEAERKAAQAGFFEQATAEADERKKQLKEWGKRFDLIEHQSNELMRHLKEIETTDLAVKRAQRSFDELVEKINRRVNELSEIQRLGEQRFRQEWSTFQADAQKRWSNFSLTNEEQLREETRQREKLADQLTGLEDVLREVQDSLQHITDQSERNLQTILEMARDSLAENERFLSNQR
jgi:chromosome segregation ATPase